MKDWKKELKDLYNACGFDHVSNCGCFGECNCVDNLTKLENFIEQIISERDKEILSIAADKLSKKARQLDYADRTEYDEAYDILKGIIKTLNK